MTSTSIGQLFSLAYTKPLSPLASSGAVPLAGAKMYFFVSGSSYATSQPVYQDSGLVTAFSQPVTADSNGRFAPIFLNSALQYGWRLFSSGNVQLAQADPVNVQNTASPAIIYSTTLTNRVSTTVLASDPYLVYTVPVAGTFKVELDLMFTAGASGATPGIAFNVGFSGSLNGSAGNTLAVAGLLNNAALPSGSVAVNGSFSAGLSVNAYYNQIRVAGTIQVTSAGTLAFNWAQANSSTNATTVLQGSSMTVTQIG